MKLGPLCVYRLDPNVGDWENLPREHGISGYIENLFSFSVSVYADRSHEEDLGVVHRNLLFTFTWEPR